MASNNIAYSFFRYTVAKNTWYKLTIKVHPSTPYKKGRLRIMNGVDKNPIMPDPMLPNIIFTRNKKASSVEEMEKYDTFDICFYSDSCALIFVYAYNLKVRSMDRAEIKPMALKREVDLWKMRRQFDLEFINYYLSKNCPDLSLPKDFLDRFLAEYKLFKNPNFLNSFFAQLSLNLPAKSTVEKNNILYLVQLSIQYERSNYAYRTQCLLNETNQIDDNCHVYAVTRYGYPYDRPENYYSDKPIVNTIDSVSYTKLTNRTDNFNTNNLIEYLKKYIVKTIQLAYALDIKVIHSCNNFMNGIAAVYAAKYLNIRAVYEVRGLYEFEHNPAVYGSDILEMRRNLENLVIQKADRIVTLNQDLKKEIIERGIDSSRIEIIPNGLTADNVVVEEDGKNQLKKGFGIDKWDLVIGYVGTAHPSLCDLILKIDELQNSLEIKVGLLFIGNGDARYELYQCAQEAGLLDSYLPLEPMDEGKLAKHIELIDIAFYPVYDSHMLRVMSQGKPILVYPTPKNKEVIQGGDNGLLIQEKNIIEMVRTLLHDDKLRDKLGKSGKEYIKNNHGWKEPGEKLYNFYSRLCKTVD